MYRIVKIGGCTRLLKSAVMIWVSIHPRLFIISGRTSYDQISVKSQSCEIGCYYILKGRYGTYNGNFFHIHSRVVIFGYVMYL